MKIGTLTGGGGSTSQRQAKTGGGGSTSQRQAKHFDIVNSIGRLDVAVRGLEDLLAEVNGGPHGPHEVAGPNDKKRELMSLVEVLNSSGASIAERAERMIDLTNSIKSAIL